MRNLLLFGMAAVLGVSGCVKLPPVKPSYTGATDPMWKVVQDINANNAPIRTLWASHTFEAVLVDDKGKARAFSGDGFLIFAKPDNLLLTAGGLIKYFELGSNDTTYWFTAFPDEVSTQWWGQREKFTEQAAKQIPIRPDLLLEVLGVTDVETNFKQPPAPTMRFNNDADAYMFVWNQLLPDRWAAVKEVWYSRETKLPSLVLLFDANGRVILRAYLKDHKPVEGVSGRIATQFDLFFPENKSQMSFRLTEVRSKKDKGKITIPNPGTFAFPEDPGVKKQIEIQ